MFWRQPRRKEQDMSEPWEHILDEDKNSSKSIQIEGRNICYASFMCAQHLMFKVNSPGLCEVIIGEQILKLCRLK